MIEAGSRVRISPHPSWTANLRRLADSGRVGMVERVFRPQGASDDVARVVFPQQGRRKERVEFMRPADLIKEQPNTYRGEERWST